VVDQEGFGSFEQTHFKTYLELSKLNYTLDLFLFGLKLLAELKLATTLKQKPPFKNPTAK